MWAYYLPKSVWLVSPTVLSPTWWPHRMDLKSTLEAVGYPLLSNGGASLAQMGMSCLPSGFFISPLSKLIHTPSFISILKSRSWDAYMRSNAICHFEPELLTLNIFFQFCSFPWIFNNLIFIYSQLIFHYVYIYLHIYYIFLINFSVVSHLAITDTLILLLLPHCCKESSKNQMGGYPCNKALWVNTQEQYTWVIW